MDNPIMFFSIRIIIRYKITIVMDSKPTKSVGHFEKNKFSVGCHQFLLDCCPKLIKIYNFGQIPFNKVQLKNQNEQLGCLFSKLPRLFVKFFIRDCQYFLPCNDIKSPMMTNFQISTNKILNLTYHFELL